MNRPPAFQFYPKDWLDFRVQRMSLAAQGAYVKVLCFMWKDSKDQCSILDDDKAIATAIGVPCEDWLKLRAEIQFKGDEILKVREGTPRYLCSERLKREAEKQRKYAETQAENGKRGAEKRWGKQDSDGHSDPISDANGGAIAKGMAKNSSSSSSSLKEIQRENSGSQQLASPRTSQPNTKKKPVLIPLPDGFTISDDLWAWTTKKEFQREFVEQEFDKFCNDRLSKGVQYADWDRAFMTWLGRQGEFSPSRRNGHLPPSAHRRKELIPL